MAKQFFKDLPDTSTPLTASRLNGLLDGEEAMGNLVVDSIRSKNMLNQNIYNLGYYDNSGTFTSSSTNVVFYYIPVESNKNYVFSAVSNCQNIAIVEFDSSKTFIKRNILYTNKTISITTSDTTQYIRCQLNYNNSTIAKSTIDTLKPQFETGDTATAYSPYQNLDGYDNYSTGEQVIGTWIDSKPLYRKTLYFASNGGGTSEVSYTLSNYGITNVDTIFITHPSFYSNNLNGYKNPFQYYDGNKYSCGVNATTLIVTLGYAPISNSPFVITLEYTKTTD